VDGCAPGADRIGSGSNPLTAPRTRCATRSLFAREILPGRCRRRTLR
jgi:hypothetical protein